MSRNQLIDCLLLHYAIAGEFFRESAFDPVLFAQSQFTTRLQCSTEVGLPDNRVMCTTKDHKGIMWFGTWAGITHFDDHNFVTFSSQSGERSNFETNSIDGIVEDAKGFLWLY